MLAALSWEEQVKFWWDDNGCFALDQHTELYFLSGSSLKQQFAGRHVIALEHITLIPSHSSLCFHSLAEKQAILIFQSLVLLIRFSVPRSTALEAITVDLK